MNHYIKKRNNCSIKVLFFNKDNIWNHCTFCMKIFYRILNEWGHKNVLQFVKIGSSKALTSYLIGKLRQFTLGESKNKAQWKACHSVKAS